MKKLLVLVAIVAMTLLTVSPVFAESAKNEQDLIDKMSQTITTAQRGTFTLSRENLNKAKDALAKVELSKKQIAEVDAYIDEAIVILKTYTVKEEANRAVADIAVKAANVMGLKVSVDSGARYGEGEWTLTLIDDGGNKGGNSGSNTNTVTPAATATVTSDVLKNTGAQE